jgi:hypothetical protein
MNPKKLTLFILSVLGPALGAVVPLWPVPREADAVVGRPLTPMSYAGVARRTTRRTVVAGAAVASTPYYPYPYYW